MFSLQPTDAQTALEARLRTLGAERLRPAGLAAEREHTLPPGLDEELDTLGIELHTKPDLVDPFSALIACEALAFGDPGIAYALLPSFQVAHLLRGSGAAETLLPRIAPMWSAASSLMLFEGFGRGQTELETTATRDGGLWSVSGRKIAVHHPGVADVTVLVARTDSGELAAWALDGPPLRCRTERESGMTGALGAAVTSTGTVRLNGATCTDDQRLGWSPPELHRAVGYARLMLGAVQIGAAAAAVDHAGRYAAQRQTFGRPLTSYQGVSFVLVDCGTIVDTARLELWEAAQRLAAPADPASVDRLVGRAVRAASSAATRVTREGIQLLGVHGIVTEHPVERFWRHASTLSLIDFDPLATPLSRV